MLAFLARVRWLTLSKGIARVWLLLLITFTFHIFLSGQNKADFGSILTFDITPEALDAALLFTGRLVLILTVSIVLFALYTPGQMSKEAGKWFSKLPFGRRTVAQIELLIALSLRFVPYMGQEHRRLQLALTARGNVPTGRLSKFFNWRQIMYPLMINAFRRADHVAVALQARGYDPMVIRTNFFSRRMTVVEAAGSTVITALAFVAPWL